MNIFEDLFVLDNNWSQLRCLATDEWLNKLVYSYHGKLFNNIKEQTIDTHNN